MKRNKILGIVLILLAGLAGTAQGQTVATDPGTVPKSRPLHGSFDNALDRPLRFSIGASTAGIKGEVSYRFAPRWAVRGFIGGGITAFVDGNISGIDYSANLRLGGAAVNLDFYPFRNRFRVSGGAFLTDTVFDGRAKGRLKIGDNFYDSSIRTQISLARSVAPMLSAGYEIPLGKRFLLTADVGAIYADKFKVTITPEGGQPIDVSDLVRESDQIANPKFPFYPFVSLNLAFVF